MTYKCTLCGRNKFDRPYAPHRCSGGFRKNFKKFERLTGKKAFVEITNES